MMDGRVKTLHPKVHAGILCRRDHPDDMAALQQHGIVSFELVVVNLYPFEATVARPEVNDAEAIEQIDIGGPSLIRAAAKNHAFVTVVTSPEQYAEVLAEITRDRSTSYELRRKLAARHTVRPAATTWPSLSTSPARKPKGHSPGNCKSRSSGVKCCVR